MGSSYQGDGVDVEDPKFYTLLMGHKVWVHCLGKILWQFPKRNSISILVFTHEKRKLMSIKI
jgi:hypothetical protein